MCSLPGGGYELIQLRLLVDQGMSRPGFELSWYAPCTKHYSDWFSYQAKIDVQGMEGSA